jgi:hypothetical protein
MTEYLPRRAFPCLGTVHGIEVVSHQGCCDRRFFSPLETGVQPMQALPYVQDLWHLPLHPFGLSRFSAMLVSPLPFDARWDGCPGRISCSQPPALSEQSHMHRNGALSRQAYDRPMSASGETSLRRAWIFLLRETRAAIVRADNPWYVMDLWEQTIVL